MPLLTPGGGVGLHSARSSTWSESFQETLRMGQEEKGYAFKITIRTVSGPSRDMKGDNNRELIWGLYKALAQESNY